MYEFQYVERTKDYVKYELDIPNEEPTYKEIKKSKLSSLPNSTRARDSIIVFIMMIISMIVTFKISLTISDYIVTATALSDHPILSGLLYFMVVVATLVSVPITGVLCKLIFNKITDKQYISRFIKQDNKEKHIIKSLITPFNKLVADDRGEYNLMGRFLDPTESTPTKLVFTIPPDYKFIDDFEDQTFARAIEIVAKNDILDFKYVSNEYDQVGRLYENRLFKERIDQSMRVMEKATEIRNENGVYDDKNNAKLNKTSEELKSLEKEHFKQLQQVLDDLDKTDKPKGKIQIPNVVIDPKGEIQKNMSVKEHIVKEDETLYGIARKYDISVEELKQLNNKKSNMISYGEHLIVRE